MLQRGRHLTFIDCGMSRVWTPSELEHPSSCFGFARQKCRLLACNTPSFDWADEVGASLQYCNYGSDLKS